MFQLRATAHAAAYLAELHALAREKLTASAPGASSREAMLPGTASGATSDSRPREFLLDDTTISNPERFQVLNPAESIAARQRRLHRKAEPLPDVLAGRHGHLSATVVMSYIALLGTCDRLHIIRRCHDLADSGGRALWVLVSADIVLRRQSQSNEIARANEFSVSGAARPLVKEDWEEVWTDSTR
ncbi:hypothetical protein BE17_29250 [Sorangium cellulosum]|uniref:Uncharacterized protein n=1 Tax=Sorangium cellulosum TaxID=56 RepID=A0A150RQD1_SORCE|nr:hypothetical protein BE17_29250 [Sorangium cellulosum]